MFPTPPLWSDGERRTSGYWPGGNALASFEGVYRSQPVVAAVVDKLSRRVAALPLEAYRELSNGAREVERGSSLATLLNRPMPGRTRIHLVQHIMQSMLIHGSAVVAKLRGPDRTAPPVQLWPLDWTKLSAVVTVPGGTITWWGTSQFSASGMTDRWIRAEDVILFAWQAPSGDEIGVSPLEKLGVTLSIEDAAQREQVSMFRKGIRPSAAVSMETQNGSYPSQKQLQQASDAVKQAHGGMDNSGSWVWLGANAKVQPLSFSPVEAALIDQRKLGREEVGMVYDLAGPLMNDLTHGTYSNVEELNKGLYRDVLPPWLALIEQTLQAQLIDPELDWVGAAAGFDLSDKLRGTPEELTAALKMQVEAGLITRNEARRILQMPPMPEAEADSLTVNANNQSTLEAINAPSQPAQQPALPAPPSSPQQ